MRMFALYVKGSEILVLWRGKALLDSMFSLYPEEERKITETARARGLDHGDHTL
jgi:hypothetical protein